MTADRKRAATTLLEWVTAILGGLIAIGLLGFIGIEALDGGAARAPAIEVRAVNVVDVPTGYLVEIEVENVGGEDTASVEVEGTIRTPEGEEVGRAVLDFVPGGSRRRAGLFFTKDPRDSGLELRATGYQSP